MGAWAERHVFERVGGRVSLDFLNTMSGLRGVKPTERLLEYADLAWWAGQAGLVSTRRMRELQLEEARNPGRAGEALREAIRWREALHGVVAATVAQEPPPAKALDTVNAWIASAMQHRRLRPAGGGRFEATFEDDGDLLAFLRPVAADAAELLEHDLATGRVHVCEQRQEGSCGWIFLDQTRNGSRRWCSMQDCGNRAKQRRHWLRQKEG